jgi:alpha-glucosidase
MMVGEVFLPEPTQVVTYYGTREQPELHLAFNFKPLFTGWEAAAWRQRIDEVETLFKPRGTWPTWVLSNHDRPRHRTRYGSEARARAAAVLLLTLRGTPFLYAGEELGLEDASVPPERRLDPGGRDGCRAPIPWDGTPAHGWAGGPDPWLPWPPDAEAGRTVAEEGDRPQSMLRLYRRLLAARRQSEALQGGEFSWWQFGATDGESKDGEAGASRGAPGVLAYLRSAAGPTGPNEGGDVRLVVVNFTDSTRQVDVPPGDWKVDVSTDGSRSSASISRWLSLAADEAVILRPVRPL